uniref:Uncharacterized protein n=1 Tax=Arundo donax TaxID=35708 RepID=A0A0A9DHK9_ARUDO
MLQISHKKMNSMWLLIFVQTAEQNHRRLRINNMDSKCIPTGRTGAAVPATAPTAADHLQYISNKYYYFFCTYLIINTNCIRIYAVCIDMSKK